MQSVFVEICMDCKTLRTGTKVLRGTSFIFAFLLAFLAVLRPAYGIIAVYISFSLSSCVTPVTMFIIMPYPCVLRTRSHVSKR